MTGNDLIRLYEFSYLSMGRNLEGVTHEDSLIGGNPAGNCINWVLGHVVSTRSSIMKFVGVDQPHNDELDRYRRGTEPIGSGETLIDFSILRRMLDDSQAQLLPALGEIPQARLDSPIPEEWGFPSGQGNIGNALARLAAHESYHNGQIGLLRRILGKEGAIR